MSHECHALGCGKEIPPRLLMCLRHWNMVSKTDQREVWEHYRPGQEIDKRPTMEYLAVQRRVVAKVAQKEGRPAKEWWPVLFESVIWSYRAAKKRGDAAMVAALEPQLDKLRQKLNEVENKHREDENLLAVDWTDAGAHGALPIKNWF